MRSQQSLQRFFAATHSSDKHYKSLPLQELIDIMVVLSEGVEVALDYTRHVVGVGGEGWSLACVTIKFPRKISVSRRI